MATGYQIEVQEDSGAWAKIGIPHDSLTAACIVIAGIPGLSDRKTRIEPVDMPRSWVPDRIPEAERAAEIALLRTLADDLSYGQANYAATLESIVVRARRLFDDEARMIGRGYKDGENTACQKCDGVYVKTLDKLG